MIVGKLILLSITQDTNQLALFASPMQWINKILPKVFEPKHNTAGLSSSCEWEEVE